VAVESDSELNLCTTVSYDLSILDKIRLVKQINEPVGLLNLRKGWILIMTFIVIEIREFFAVASILTVLVFVLEESSPSPRH